MTGFEILGAFILAALWDAAKRAGYATKEALEPSQPDAQQLQVTEGDREWIGNVEKQVAVVLPQLQTEVADVLRHIRELQDDEATRKVFGNLGFEAAREATRERRIMLAYAAAALLHPKHDIEARARLERKLRDLDSTDVRHLHGLQLARMAPRAPGSGKVPEDLMWEKHRAEGERLVAAGCAYLRSGGFGGVSSPVFEITSLGFAMLDVMARYMEDRGPLSTVDDVLGGSPQ